MPEHDDPHGAVVLDRSTCLALLKSVDVGRIAWPHRDNGRIEVSILPVNFAMHGERELLFRTGHGGKLDAVRTDGWLTFETDDLEPALSSGWSVLAMGDATEVTDPGLRRDGEQLVEPWEPSAKRQLIRLRIRSVTGRRILPRPGTVRTVRVGFDDQ